MEAERLIDVGGNVVMEDGPDVDPGFVENSLLLAVDLDVLEHEQRHLLLQP